MFLFYSKIQCTQFFLLSYKNSRQVWSETRSATLHLVYGTYLLDLWSMDSWSLHRCLPTRAYIWPWSFKYENLILIPLACHLPPPFPPFPPFPSLPPLGFRVRTSLNCRSRGHFERRSLIAKQIAQKNYFSVVVFVYHVNIVAIGHGM